MLTTERMIDLEREALGEVGMLGRERWSSTRSAALGEGGNAVSAALLGERIAAGAGELAVSDGQFAGLGQGDEPGGAESEFAPSSPDDEPLDPASGSGGLDEQVQPVPIGVPAWRCGTDEGGRERLLGMASSALGSAGSGGGFGYKHPLLFRQGEDEQVVPRAGAQFRSQLQKAAVAGADRDVLTAAHRVSDGEAGNGANPD